MNKREVFLTKKNINNLKIVVISDVHYSKRFRLNVFNKVLKQIENIKPKYIFIIGDLIDCKDINYDVIEEFLREVQSIGRVFIVFGNHELYNYNKGIRCKEIDKDNFELRRVIGRLDNCYLLDNGTYVDEVNNISVSGINLSDNYYENDENIEIFIKEIRSKITNLDSNKYNILLIHSPYNIYKDRVKKDLEKYDLILSGHMHGGLVHPWISFLFGKNNGLISPRREWFPKLVRGRIDRCEFDSYVYEGITKLAWGTGSLLVYFDWLYPKKVLEIDIEKRRSNHCN